jgi:hypothetical protein
MRSRGSRARELDSTLAACTRAGGQTTVRAKRRKLLCDKPLSARSP